MNSFYKLTENSLYSKEVVELDFVECSFKEIEELCEKLNKPNNNNLKSFYSYVPANVEVINENGELFKVAPISFKNGMNISETQYDVIKDSKQGVDEKIKTINKSSNVQYEYEKLKVMTPSEVLKSFESKMNKSNFKNVEFEMER